MATYTSHLNLKLPDYSDVADVKDLNDNFKKIDDAIASGGTGGGTGGITQETDPTVPSWAKQPNKPTYTAAEVGALPNTTVIPTVPTTLPNPQPIVINGVSYDGSEKKEITIQAEDGGIVTETDPTVPDWAKAANKPTYTAEEVGALPSTYEPPVMSVNGKTGAVELVASDVGALPNTTVIPTVPDALKNPYPLTINGIAYDGSEAKTVTIESTGGGASVELDTTLTQYNKAADAGAVGNALAQEAAAREEAVNELNEANDAQDAAIEALGGSVHKRTNVMIIAHRGWHKTAAQNTIEAFIDAVKNGFKWLEIDIRKTADNVYVMAHDATVTLYNNGTAQSVTIASANYADIKDMTWDAAGSYKISTLAGVFGAMRAYDVRLVCDRKSGNNADIVRLAAHSGMIDKIMLSYASASAAIAEKALLLKYDHVPIRVYLSDPNNIETLRTQISNPMYADVNVDGNQSYIATALACDIPIVFAGCKESNKAMWQVLAAGCMANLDENISYDDFAESVSIDYTDTTTITGDSAVTVAPNETKTVSFTSTLDTPAGYIYAYMLDTTCANITQKTYGASVNVEITGKAEGSAEVILFCGNGAVKTVSVTVAVEEEETVPCTGITLNQTALTFDGIGSQTLTATVTPSNTTDAVVWSSDDTSIASVSNGVVTAKANGSATITAKCGEYSATCTVSVSGIEVVAGEYVWVVGTTESNGTWVEAGSGQYHRATYYTTENTGMIALDVDNNSTVDTHEVPSSITGKLYLPKIPDGAKYLNWHNEDSSVLESIKLHDANGAKITTLNSSYGMASPIDLSAYPTAVYWVCDCKYGTANAKIYANPDSSLPDAYTRYQAICNTVFSFTDSPGGDEGDTVVPVFKNSEKTVEQVTMTVTENKHVKIVNAGYITNNMYVKLSDVETQTDMDFRNDITTTTGGVLLTIPAGKTLRTTVSNTSLTGGDAAASRSIFIYNGSTSVDIIPSGKVGENATYDYTPNTETKVYNVGMWTNMATDAANTNYTLEFDIEVEILD